MTYFQCPVPGCYSHSGKENVTWHLFPSEEIRKQLWITASRVRDPHDHSKICSLHFKPSDFSDEAHLVCKETAVPSRFPWMNENLLKIMQQMDNKLHDFPASTTDLLNSTKVETPKMECEEDDIKNLRTKSNEIIFYNGINGQNGHFDLVKHCSNSLQTVYSRKISNAVKEVKIASNHVNGLLMALNKPSTNIRNFLSTKKFLFKSSLESLRNNPSIVQLFKKPYQMSQTVPKKEVSADGLEIVKEFKGSSKLKNLPPPGELKRSPLGLSSKVLVLKTPNPLGIWVKGTVSQINDNNGQITYRVKIGGNISLHKPYSAKQLAYEKPPDVQIPVGTRVVARYRPEDTGMRPSMYAGIIAEPPKLTNKFRYLVFFDDGYAQYVEHEDICVVCSQSADVTEDIHPGMKEFMKSYLRQYPERPMVKLQRNQFIKTEWNGKWWQAKVVEVDGSMVKMCFVADQRAEWIYRGSTRLNLLFNELANAEAHRLSGKHRRHNIVQKKPHQPYVEYTRESEVVVLDSDEDDAEVEARKNTRPKRKTGGSQYIEKDKPKNTARKSTGARPICNEPPTQQPDIKSHQGYKETHQLTVFKRRTYISHTCSILCKETEDPFKYRGRSPLLIPIFLGWERQIRRRCRGILNIIIIYRAPCGRHLRSLKEVNKYLHKVSSNVTIDWFSFHCNVFIFRSFRPKEEHYRNDDVTEGKENVPVSCINSFSKEPPPYVEYAAERYPGKGVHLNLDEEFLCGCSCTDNCMNRDRCECQQLTVRAASKEGSHAEVGYDNKRLKEPVVTGIYECNSRCKCGPQCGNRVVQHGLQVRLQMFKTLKKGWGIRCLDDIDAGMFICIYAGQLLTEQGADEDGHQFGDEYLAELDHIEVVEKIKEDYESDVPECDMDLDVENKNEVQADAQNEDEDEDELGEQSDEYVNICGDDSDSDFESPLRNTAMSTYATRSKRRGRDSNGSPLADTVSDLSLADDSSSNMDTPESEKKELPDIDFNFSPFKSNPLTIRPLSPTSSELVEKTELGRKPKIVKMDENGLYKVAAKKSVSMKHPMSYPAIPPKKRARFMSIRSFYNEDSCYIMDAKSKGNIGRYLNHSCHPNVFVQNVFVDTHDLRFPTVAFFAQNYIDAGTELTWDYNYEVGSVEGKVMYCYCETRKCRGRLL